MKECQKCHFILEDNTDAERVSKMIKIKKSNLDNLTYPILVADFNCNKCKKTVHIKWSDANEEFSLSKCPECNSDLTVSVFLGLMNGFNLKSVCFSCYTELSKGNIGGFQK
jgi:predicted Zn-ribbon and HTH transcriptional regulator